MLLETVVEVTADESWPTWVEPALLILGGVLGGLGIATIVVKRKAAKAVASVGAVALAFTLTGCFESVPKSWVEADRATYDLIAPEYDAYVDADPKLTDLQKKLRKSATATWELRLKTNEKAVE